jgi:hypothetical protein
MSMEFCKAFCTPGYPLFGMEYGSECWCGYAIGVGSVLAAASDCNMACSGNAEQSCGGSYRLNVYSNGQVAVVVPTTGAYNFLGCYSEATGIRALASTATFGVTDMTVEKCAAFCADYTMFGVEFGYECYCGNELQLGSALMPTTDCNMVCAGSTREFCGAANRLNVYQRS